MKLQPLLEEIFEGDYTCQHRWLKQLKNIPSAINGSFDCSHNSLKSLKGCPSIVNGSFKCHKNLLTSLKDGPSSVRENFNCDFNSITSLEGVQRHVHGYFSCDHNLLSSLKGAPSYVNGDFYCADNKLTSLEGVHKIFKEIKGAFYASMNPIKSHVLGLLLINKLTGVILEEIDVADIINKYLPNTKGNKWVFECQSELIDAGFDEYAQL